MSEKKSIDKVKTQIGVNIKKIRQDKGLAVKEVANSLLLSQAAYSNIERGVTDISISRVLQIAEFFEVHFSEILSVDKTSIYNFNSNNNSTGTQHNSQMSSNSVEAYLISIENLKNEVNYLRELNTKLLSK
jgi:XRE family transcriptional regulator, regulator of sulfur utilization